LKAKKRGLVPKIFLGRGGGSMEGLGSVKKEGPSKKEKKEFVFNACPREARGKACSCPEEFKGERKV